MKILPWYLSPYPLGSIITAWRVSLTLKGPGPGPALQMKRMCKRNRAKANSDWGKISSPQTSAQTIICYPFLKMEEVRNNSFQTF